MLPWQSSQHLEKQKATGSVGCEVRQGLSPRDSVSAAWVSKGMSLPVPPPPVPPQHRVPLGRSPHRRVS